MHRATLRPLASDDGGAALALLRDALPEPMPYMEILVEGVQTASAAPCDDTRGIVAAVDGELAGVAVYGRYAGASGAGRLHLVVVAPQHRALGVGAALVARVADELRARGARFVIAELPDDRALLGGYLEFLGACSFSEEARVEDLYRDGVALLFLRREL